MRRSLVRRSEWLCLLGTLLALVAFFLPYATYTPGGLEDCLTSCALNQVFQSPTTQFKPVPWGVGVLLFLLLGIAVLAFLALFLHSPRWKITTIYLRLTALTLIYYLVAALITLFLAWVGDAIASGVTFIDTMSLVNIGAWLILAGLMLAFIGGILLKRRESKASG